MKKLIAILCTLVCVLAMTACGESQSDLEKQKEKDRIDETKTMLVTEYAFETAVELIDSYSMEDKYYSISVFNNEETESLLNNNSSSVMVEGHGFKTALESFRLSKETTGAFKRADDGSLMLGTVTAKISGDKIVANADVKCEKKDATIELIFSNDIFMDLKGGSLNPKSSFSELMAKAGLNTLIGMGTVFAVLILISLIIACFGIIPKIQKAFEKKEEAPAAPSIAPVVPTQTEVAVEEDDDTELVAVIAAAIAAYEGSTNTDGFVVRSIRRR